MFHTGLPCSRQALEHAIANGPHVLACPPYMTLLIHWETQKRVQDGFIILLPVADVVHIFGEKLKLSRIAAVPRHISDRA